ncbi:hypothetical protein D770_01895 [Flammeovirgaceae bacterium 311]|nr:hypothetical protein D770_01895 [Flammeovirgaceae bacterium 311]
MLSLKDLRNPIPALLVLVVLLGVGYIREEYFLFWESPLKFSLIHRSEETAANAAGLLVQLPGLVLYLLLFYLGNSALLNLLTKDKSWWKKLLLLYLLTTIVAVFLLILNRLIPLNALTASTQLLKEFLLSPLPSLIILPLIWWQNSQLK